MQYSHKCEGSKHLCRCFRSNVFSPGLKHCEAPDLGVSPCPQFNDVILNAVDQFDVSLKSDVDAAPSGVMLQADLVVGSEM